LSRALAQRTSTSASSPSSAVTTVGPSTIAAFENTSESLDDDAGYEDLLSDATADMAQITTVMERIRTLSEGLAERQQCRNPDLTNPARRRDALDATAEDLRNYPMSLTQEATQLAFFQERAFGALAKGVVIASEDGAMPPKETQELQDRIVSASSSIAKFAETVGGTRETLANMPRATRSLNVARRNAIGALDLLRSKLEASLRIQDTILMTLRNVKSKE
jgi:hypothetical protein